MNDIFKWILFFAACLILQSTMTSSIAIAGIKPDLLMLGLFMLAISRGSLLGIYVGFIIGLTMDLYAPSLLGQKALSLTITGFIMGLFNEKTVRTGPGSKLLILLLAFIVCDSCSNIIESALNHRGLGSLLPTIFFSSIPRALYTAIFGALYYLWMNYSQPSFRR